MVPRTEPGERVSGSKEKFLKEMKVEAEGKEDGGTERVVPWLVLCVNLVRVMRSSNTSLDIAEKDPFVDLINI